MQALISARNLNKSFINNEVKLNVLNDINLDIYQGEMAAIMGPSGVGKSTLLHILGSLDKPTSGQVIYEDNDIFSLDEGRLAEFRNKTVGFVFQFHHLLPEFNALENVMMPSLIRSGGNGYKAMKDRAESLLSDMGLYARKGHKPGELSGGEQQRLAIARALMLNPKVVLADEPTGNLDTHTGKEIFSILGELNKKNGTTFLIVTHNEALASKCRRIIKMLDGRIV